MPSRKQHNRHNTVGADAYTGLIGEVTADTDKKELRYHDGTTVGGVPALRADYANEPAATAKVGKALFDANTVLAADTDNTPAAVTLAEQTILGRITAGNIKGLSVAEILTLINVEAGADVTDATNVATALANGVAALSSAEVAQLANIGPAVISAADWLTLQDAVKNNLIAVVAPVVTDDSSGGYSVGSLWVDIVLNQSHICVDASVGAAIWSPYFGPGTGDLVSTNNLSDVASAATSRTNLGLAIGTDVQAFNSILQNTTASFLTADETKLDAISGTNTGNEVAATTTIAGIVELSTSAENIAGVAVTTPTVAGVKEMVDTHAPATPANLVINGNMSISQRGTSFATPANNEYTIDRFKWGLSGSSAIVTVTQDTDVPAGEGFKSSLKVAVTTADAAVAAGDLAYVIQSIEGFNTAHLEMGTANAKTVTLSFWVKSTITGTYCLGISNSASNRSYRQEYTISAADTWEQKTITVALDQTGTWLGATNGNGLTLHWTLISGTTYQGVNDTWDAGVVVAGTSNQVNALSNAANNFLITGVMLVEGTTAPSTFVLAGGGSYGAELALCQRYYEQLYSGEASGMWRTATIVDLAWTYKVTKRTAPTVALANTTPRVLEPAIINLTATGSTLTRFSVGNNTDAAGISLNGFSGANTGKMAIINGATNGIIIADAEL